MTTKLSAMTPWKLAAGTSTFDEPLSHNLCLLSPLPPASPNSPPLLLPLPPFSYLCQSVILLSVSPNLSRLLQFLTVLCYLLFSL